MMNWIVDCYWSWRNVIEFRLDYNDRIDYCAFWEEINLGYYQMRDEAIMKQPGFDPYNLSGRDSYYNFVLKRYEYRRISNSLFS
jgi:hypothetical protein